MLVRGREALPFVQLVMDGQSVFKGTIDNRRTIGFAGTLGGVEPKMFGRLEICGIPHLLPGVDERELPFENRAILIADPPGSRGSIYAFLADQRAARHDEAIHR